MGGAGVEGASLHSRGMYRGVPFESQHLWIKCPPLPFRQSAEGKAETWCEGQRQNRDGGVEKRTQHTSDISKKSHSSHVQPKVHSKRLGFFSKHASSPPPSPPNPQLQFLNVRHVRTLPGSLSTFSPLPPLVFPTHIHSHHRCHGGDGGHLIVFCPGLQVLQGVQGRVVQAERVGLQRLAQRLLEGLLLQLQHQPVGLLPLGFPLLGCLPPGGRRGRYKTQIKEDVRPLGQSVQNSSSLCSKI